MRGIFIESLRGAIIRILRIIIYIIIILSIFFFVGLFSKNKEEKRSGINASEIMEKL